MVVVKANNVVIVSSKLKSCASLSHGVRLKRWSRYAILKCRRWRMRANSALRYTRSLLAVEGAGRRRGEGMLGVSNAIDVLLLENEVRYKPPDSGLRVQVAS